MIFEIPTNLLLSTEEIEMTKQQYEWDQDTQMSDAQHHESYGILIYLL